MFHKYFTRREILAPACTTPTLKIMNGREVSARTSVACTAHVIGNVAKCYSNLYGGMKIIIK